MTVSREWLRAGSRLRPGTDSLNVAAATAVACYALQRR